jgi:hypothetical protein
MKIDKIVNTSTNSGPVKLCAIYGPDGVKIIKVRQSFVHQVKKARHATYIGEWLAKFFGCL